MRRVVIWGAGELGGRVAAIRAAAGDRVVALTRTVERHAALRAAGAGPGSITPGIGAPVDLGADDALLVALPGTDRQTMAVVALREQAPPGRVVLVSSTGFLGNARGRVDEATGPGEDEHAGRVAALEALFGQWAGERGVVLRCGGLYRVGRGPLSALGKSWRRAAGAARQDPRVDSLR
jgi:nucleoside-diphosphate-sugar epimerase